MIELILLLFSSQGRIHTLSVTILVVHCTQLQRFKHHTTCCTAFHHQTNTFQTTHGHSTTLHFALHNLEASGWLSLHHTVNAFATVLLWQAAVTDAWHDEGSLRSRQRLCAEICLASRDGWPLSRWGPPVASVGTADKALLLQITGNIRRHNVFLPSVYYRRWIWNDEDFHFQSEIY